MQNIRRVFAFALFYAIAQVIIGVILGVAAAVMVFMGGWTLPGALALVLPIGFPAALVASGYGAVSV